MTSVMVAPERAAAKSSGARSFWATAYQKSESWSPPRSPARAVEASQAAMRRAPCQSSEVWRGDHPAEGSAVEPTGSKT